MTARASHSDGTDLPPARGRVRVIRSLPQLGRWPPPGATNETDLHDILGANIDGLEFYTRCRSLDDTTRSKITGVTSRLQLANAIEQETSFTRTWDRLQADALVVYLLCTCMDALAGQAEHRQFHEWIALEEQKDVLEAALAGLEASSAPLKERYTEVTKALASRWLDAHGVSRNFRRFVHELPAPLRNALVEAYAIIREPEERREDWVAFPEEVRLRRVVEYLFNLRRNTFTHRALIVPTIVPEVGIAGWVCAIPPGMWDFSVYFRQADNVRGEPSLLRLIVIGAIRQLVGYEVDEAFIQLQWRVEGVRRKLRLALRELKVNSYLRGTLLGGWPIDLSTAPPSARPARFLFGSLKDLCVPGRVKFSWWYPFTPEEDREMHADIREYVGETQRMNDLVKKYEELAVRPRVHPKTKIAAYERLREEMRDGEWSNLATAIASGLYYVLDSAPEHLDYHADLPS